MSSYDLKSKLRGGEEIQNLTLQWGYRQNQLPSQKPIERDHDSELFRNVMNFLNPIISKVLMLAGVATTATAIAWANGLLVL